MAQCSTEPALLREVLDLRAELGRACPVVVVIARLEQTRELSACDPPERQRVDRVGAVDRILQMGDRVVVPPHEAFEYPEVERNGPNVKRDGHVYVQSVPRCEEIVKPPGTRRVADERGDLREERQLQ